jgi:translation elongation factor EF-Ts
MGQNFVKDDQFTVEKYVTSVSKDLNDKVVPLKFSKFVIGE